MPTKTIKKSSKTVSQKPAKRTTQTRKSSSKTRVESAVEVENAQNTSVRRKRDYSRNYPIFQKPYIITLVVIVLVIALLYYFRGLYIAAIVNGQPISQLTYINELKKQSGKQVLNTLVTETLIQQEATKEHVTVNQTEINNELANIEKSITAQGQSLDQVLAAQGMTEQTLEDQIKYQLLIQKMVGKSITVSNKEITDYINANKDSLPQNQTDAQLQQSAKQQIQQQKLSNATQAFVANLQKNANIVYLGQ